MDANQFNALLSDLRDAPVVAVDTEADGLDVWGTSQPIGISFYVPHVDRSYYVPIGHGVHGTFPKAKITTPVLRCAGVVQFITLRRDGHSLRYKTGFKGARFKCVSKSKAARRRFKRWQRSTPAGWKKILSKITRTQYNRPALVQRAWQRLVGDSYRAANVPDAVERLAVVIPTVKLWLMHNAQFDCAMLEKAGLPRIVAPIHDTAVMAYVIRQTWQESVFDVVRDGESVSESGSKALKWLGAHFGMPLATSGEERLEEAATQLTAQLQAAVSASGTKSGIEPLDSKSQLWALPPDVVGYYAELDVRLTHGIYEAMRPLVNSYNAWSVFETLCAVQQEVTLRMTRTGFRVDLERLDGMVSASLAELRQLQKDINKEVGGWYINVNSSPQLKEYLKGIGIAVSSTGKDELEAHKDEARIIPLTLLFRERAKLLSGYGLKWQQGHVDGIVRAEFNIGGTKTARLSSSSERFGNMQNIPRTDTATLAPKNVLKAIHPDWVLVELDYSTLEIRIAAWVAEHLMADPTWLLDGAETGNEDLPLHRWKVTYVADYTPDQTLTRIGIGDMHTYTMNNARIPEILLGEAVSQEAVDRFCYHLAMPSMSVDVWLKKVARAAAKTVNFAAMYGGGARAIQKPLGLRDEDAKRVAYGWRETYPSVPHATATLQALAKLSRQRPNPSACQYEKSRYFLYPDVGFGRFPRTYEKIAESARDADGKVYSPLDKATYTAFNHMVQGTAGLIMLYSALRIARLAGDDRLHLHATVHDSIVMSVRPDSLSLVVQAMDIMRDYDTTPALEVDLEAASIGAAWGDKRKVVDVGLWVASGGREGLK